jgi:hypothetical protein
MPKQLRFQSFIDIDKWNAAKWKGVGFLVDLSGEKPPCILIVFNNGEIGKKIFSAWRKEIGKLDEFEELRIAIIEGDIPGQDPGYTIHINSDPSHTTERVRALGMILDPTGVIVVSRIHRMNPSPGSPYLKRFKEAYKQHGKYLLVPAAITNNLDKPFDPYFDFAISKTQIYFRNVSEITEHDIDYVIFSNDITNNWPKGLIQ